MLYDYYLYNQKLSEIPQTKAVINTLNAHCYNLAFKDKYYKEALLNSDIILPDGISVVWAFRWLKGQKIYKIAGADLFIYEMKRLQKIKGKCFFLGSSKATLEKIKKKVSVEYPNIKTQFYSPPFKSEFSIEDDKIMLELINEFNPNVLWIGMTAPKQEKWAYKNSKKLHVEHICCIGAVFDFYAGTIKRAPQWIIEIGMEWFYRMVKEPRRMWRRYLAGNIIFIFHIIVEKISLTFR